MYALTREEPERDEFVARLLSLCIEEYYRGPHRESAASATTSRSVPNETN